MKTLATIILSWLAINALALVMNLLFANTITGTITMLTLIGTLTWIATKIIKGIKL